MVDPDHYQDPHLFILASNGIEPPDQQEVRNSYSANNPSSSQCMLLAGCMFITDIVYLVWVPTRESIPHIWSDHGLACSGINMSTVIYEVPSEISKSTVKPVLSGHSKIDKTQILITNGSFMKVESSAECSPWSILQYF